MGILDSKSDSNQADGSNNANTQTGSSGVSLLPTITAGKNIKNMSLTNNVNVTTTDLGAIERAFSFSKETVDQLHNTVNYAIDSNKSVVEQAILTNADTQQAIIGLSDNFGARVEFLADGTIQGNTAITELALNNNAILTSEFGDKMLAMSDRNASLMQAANDNNTFLASQFGSDLKSAYSELGAELSAANQTTSNTLLEMAVMQERGLANALEVAGNMSMDDSAESSSEMIKYISIGIAVVGLGMVLKNG